MAGWQNTISDSFKLTIIAVEEEIVDPEIEEEAEEETTDGETPFVFIFDWDSLFAQEDKTAKRPVPEIKSISPFGEVKVVWD